MKGSIIVVVLILETLFSFGQANELILPFGHTGPVTTIAFSKNGKYIATGSQDNDAIVWNTVDGRPVRLLRGHVNWVTTLDFSKNGKFLATGSIDKLMAIWDIEKAQQVYRTADNESVVSVVRFSPNDRFVFVGCTDGSSFLVNTSDTKITPITISEKKETAPLAVMPGLILLEPKAIKTASFSADGKYLAFQNNNGDLKVFEIKHHSLAYSAKTPQTAMLFFPDQPFFQFVGATNALFVVSDKSRYVVDLTTKDTIASFKQDKMSNPITFDISRAGESLLALTPNGVLTESNLHNGAKSRLWQLENGEIIGSKLAYRANISAAKKFLAIATSADSSIYTWDIDKGKLVSKVACGSVMSWLSNPVLDLYAVAELGKEVVIRKMSDGSVVSTLVGKTRELVNAVVDIKHRQIISMAKDSVIQIWNIDHANIKQNITVSHGLSSAVVKLSGNGNYFYTWAGNKIFLYEASSGELLRCLGDSIQFNVEKATMDIVSGVNMSNNEKYICTSSSDHTVKVWEIATGKKVAILTLKNQPFTNAEFTPDSKYVIGLSAWGKIGIWNLASGKLVDTLKCTPLANSLFVSPTRNLIGYQNLSGKISIYDIDARKIVNEISLPDKNDFQRGSFAESNKFVALLGQFTCYVANLKTNTIITSIDGDYSLVKARILPDDSTLFINTSDGILHVMDIKTADEIGSLGFGDNSIFDFTDIYENKYMATGSHSIFFYDLEKDKTIQLTPLGNADYIVRIDSNYYFATPDAAKAVSWKNGESIYGFEQLDIRYNRPDKILQAIGSKDSTLIGSYTLAYWKRLRNLGFDINILNNEVSTPTCSITNEADISYVHTTNSLQIQMRLTDSLVLLDKFNIWINDVPVFGLKGVCLRKQNRHFVDTSITITLSQGENRIETSVLNVNGTESYRSPLFVKYTPLVPKQEKVHFIGIGINQFANADYNLSWSVKDIRDLALKLKEHCGNAISIDTLFDENVTRENVLALKQHLLSLGEDDIVIVSYSGHGVLSKDLDYFLSTYKISFEEPEQYGLPYDDLESLMDGIRPRKKLMLIDACHSGEVDKEEIARIETVAQKLESNGITHKSRINIVPKKTLGMANSFELMQNLFVNVSKGTGATIISAAGGMQYAQERGDLKNGVFTYSILEAFNANKTLTVSQLKKIVGERVTSLTNGLQKPTSRNETINVDWNVW